eukprot:CAMPEP_0180358484 /NCGR_PEP_ID=MMETSP0989-20121125/10582_1 /TAXON_ID=697907 /ORGANISM="non described non described, Strain CCMP2293" /LENGTH=49 /DNA_ID=CAMNT_0022348987 /DNA_START=245 /DNA_END=394 /DNA_ORIENTATION=+
MRSVSIGRSDLPSAILPAIVGDISFERSAQQLRTIMFTGAITAHPRRSG